MDITSNQDVSISVPTGIVTSDMTPTLKQNRENGKACKSCGLRNMMKMPDAASIADMVFSTIIVYSFTKYLNMYNRLLVVAVLFFNICVAQLAPLTVEKIMADPKWMGTQPGTPVWDAASKSVYFSWNPENDAADSMYMVQLTNRKPQKVVAGTAVLNGNYEFNSKRTQAVYAANGDLYLYDVKNNATQRLTQTADIESNPSFMHGDLAISFVRNQNLFAFTLSSGTLRQLTNFVRGADPDKQVKSGTQESWLKNDQLALFDILRERKEKKDATEEYNKKVRSLRGPQPIYLDEKNAGNLTLSPNGRFVSYRLGAQATGGKATIVPAYVTESGFTTDLNARTKVGAPQATGELWIYDCITDSAYKVKTDSLPGITDLPDYLKDYPKKMDERKKKPAPRQVNAGGLWWSPDGTKAVLNIYAIDNKDRWIVLLDPSNGNIEMIDRQRDEAWIGGPGIGSGFGGANGGWIDANTVWFQSELSGYSHLYLFDLRNKTKKQITTGNYEVQSAQLSNNKQFFYITTNEIHPGEKHFYRLPISGGKAERLTTLTGANEVTLSPDEQWLAIRYSYSNKPWELYLQSIQPGSKAEAVTNKAQSALFSSYAWREPELVTFKASDGELVYARLYKPAKPDPKKPAVIFVHGAGYLQNAHKWWSSYFREYMFHNLLADKGYTVLDIDYRASAGYGRNWRTGIYRFMGGKDLSDHIDGAKYLVEKHGVDASRIGVYGGSYGGFITLMALFTSPGTFAAGAALRPVTDWAHYNHGYTANILNTPAEDSLVYRKSSPIYHAAGLKDQLLICHGMVDVNVHFQDVVRLQQRLIELGKDNWELAAYPMEDHGFVEPSSWTDEYKRILQLFEKVLKR